MKKNHPDPNKPQLLGFSFNNSSRGMVRVGLRKTALPSSFSASTATPSSSASRNRRLWHMAGAWRVWWLWVENKNWKTLKIGWLRMAHSSQKLSVFQVSLQARLCRKPIWKETALLWLAFWGPRTNRNCQPNGVESSLDLPKQLESFSTHGTTIPVNPCFPQSLPKSSKPALEDATTTKAVAPSEWPAPSSRPHVEPSESTAARNPGSTRPQSSHDLPGMRLKWAKVVPLATHFVNFFHVPGEEPSQSANAGCWGKRPLQPAWVDLYGSLHFGVGC